jgi:2',3'-cyclic-nucleotide 2'-phosphodiesterase (5'-nucleotidase family)
MKKFILLIMLALILLSSAAITKPIVSDGNLGNKNPLVAETQVGSLFADAVKFSAGSDIAFIAGSEIKAKEQPFPIGKVSNLDLQSLISYPNDPLVTLNLTGKALKNALERSLSVYPQPNPGFLQVSGLKFSVDPKLPVNQRVIGILINKKPIADDQNYIVAMSSSLANGALGYWRVWDKTAIKQKYADKTISKAIEAYINSDQEQTYQKLDRIAIGS